MGVTKRAGRRKEGGQAVGSGGGRKQAIFDSSKKKEVGLSDLTLVSKITEEAINDNLKLRFEHGEIYTYIGHVLVSVNPFRMLPIYGDDTKRLYEGKNRLEAAPHVYAVAEAAYHQMRQYEENQCVIISGESGAGKTEAAKRLMEYICYRTGTPESFEATGRTASSDDPSNIIKEKVLYTNPLLEAFGNAKTLRNNNSSRFGKYLELEFKSSKGQKKRRAGPNYRKEDDDGTRNVLEPVGASIKNYLLEKSRVVGQTKNERNFHIFYQLTKSQPKQYRDAFGISGPETFEYLSRAKCLDAPGINDEADFAEVMKAMDIIEINGDERDNIFRVLAAILWLGNVTFYENDSGNASVQDASVSQYVAYLLEVDYAHVERALTLRLLKTRSEEYDVPLNVTQAVAVRDALAKALYFNLFDWIVQKLNVSLNARPEYVDNTIGILDIYGFEIFEKNSFEQLCINYVNEKLQQIFIQLTLKAEQEDYAKEQIKWTPIKYFDNKIVCDLIEEKRPPGLFAALNDACATAHADSSAADQTFVQRINGLSNPHFQPRQGQFVVKHYAGEVNYAIDGMTDKNKDQLLKDLLRLLKESSNSMIMAIFPEAVNEDDRRRPPTAGDKIKASANDLVATLMKCSPSYIRTIKPNENKSPSEYNSTNVLHQIKYLGLQENVRIRRAGFAYRQDFQKFFYRFFPLSPTISPGVEIREDWVVKNGVDFLLGVKTILKDTRIPEDQYQIGVTRVFIKDPETIFHLEHARDQHFDVLVRRIQRLYRRWKGDRVTETQRLRDQGHQLLQNKKERRRFSLLGSRRFTGDYLGINLTGGYGEIVKRAVDLGHEQALFSARSEILVTKFGRSSKLEPRMLILTTQAVYILAVVMVNQQATIQIERKVPVGSIRYVSASTLRDDWFSIGIGSAQEPDPLLTCVFKTEFFTHLTQTASRGNITVKIGEGIEYNKKPGKPAIVKAIKDPAVQREDFYKSGTIHTGTGEPPGSRSRPTPKGKDDGKQAAKTVSELTSRPSQPTHTQSRTDSSSRTTLQPAAAVNGQPKQRESYTARAVPTPPPPPPSAPRTTFDKRPMLKALYDFDGGGHTDFPISKGDIFVDLKEEQNGWSKVKREKNEDEGWAPTAYMETYTPPAPAPAPPPAPPVLPTRAVPPPPTPQTNGNNSRGPSPQPAAGGKPTPPMPPKRPAVRGKKPAPPPTPRDSAVSLSANDSGRATPDSTESKGSSHVAADLANILKAKGFKSQG